MKCITIKEYTSVPQAYIDKGLLEDNGITAVVNGEYAAGVYPAMPMLATITLAVFEPDEQTAKELLAIEPRE